MLTNKDIICISSIDWDFIWQGHQEIMTRLARNGNRVLFVENTGVRSPRLSDLGRIRKRLSNWKKGLHGIRKIEEGLYVYSPLVLPFPYLSLARYINRKLIFSVLFKWLKAVGFSDPIVWTFLPTGLVLDLVNAIRPSVLVYYCIDSFQSSSKGARNIVRTEAALLKRADLVFVTSEKLSKYCLRWAKHVHYFPFGVSIENFKMAIDRPYSLPNDIRVIKKPIAGYVGGIHKWIDFDLLRFAASENKDISFVFCGPIQSDISKVKDMPNVVFLGQKDPQSLPYYINEFDVTIIPYKIAEYTKNVYPTKLNEYLAMGKRVVSTDLPEVRRFNSENDDIIKIASTREEFVHAVRKAVTDPVGAEEKDKAMGTAGANSWANKVEKMSCLIENMEDEKMRIKEKSWKDNIIKVYERTKNKFTLAVISAAIIYAVLFHTPLIWFLAEPLRINDMPERSDAIVVLGAGVGESGRAGQNYEERVDLAVRLYKQGYAGTILYSSGYRYIMQEAEAMKLMSRAMGVEDRDIILDESPVNTYEMVRSLARISRDKGWKKIMIVSSPYHMKRAQLVCAKELNGMDVRYLPVEDSNYYSKNRGIRLRHINGIVHEYLGIIYYKFKGYI